MLAKNLIRAIQEAGGTAELRERNLTYDPTSTPNYEVVGELRGYDVHMYGESSSYFTTRKVANRGYHDPYSDYNPGGYTFCHRIKDLEWAAR